MDKTSEGLPTFFPLDAQGGTSAPLKRFITHKSSQTGDTLHVAAALALCEDLDVIVVQFGA